MQDFTLINGNCIDNLKELQGESVDCVVTSPPYYGLRDYGVSGQIGNEQSHIDYINNLLLVFTEIKRVLKNSGTCFINLGDSFGGSGSGTTSKADTNKYLQHSKQVYILPHGSSRLAKLRVSKLNKSLLMIPERFAIAMIDMGWILRNQIIWHKPNQMPSSAKDRFTVDFEKVFFFVKNSKYFFNRQLEPYTKPLDRWGGESLSPNGVSEWDNGTGQSTYRNRNFRPNPNGRNKRCVWSINTKPFNGAHFATYPEALIEPIISSGCPINGVVLDPFMGSGTTGVVALRQNKKFIGIELNSDYVEIARKRLDIGASKINA